MPSGDNTPDPPLSAEEAMLASQLSPAQLQAVDRALLAQASERPRKVALVVALAMNDASCDDIDLPDNFFAARIRELVSAGALEAFGDLASMRYSEVRLPRPPNAGRT